MNPAIKSRLLLMQLERISTGKFFTEFLCHKNFTPQKCVVMLHT